MTCPLRYVKGNVLVGRGGEAAGLYRLAMTSYPYLPTGEKWTLQRRLQRLAHTIAADFSLWRVQRAYPAEQYVKHTAGLLDERHQQPQVWEAFLAGHRERLRELGSHIPESYLAVSLAGGAPTGLGSGLVRGVDRARRRVEELAGIGSASPISAGELSELATREQRVYERLNGVLAVRRARTVELQWLLRRAACRGVMEPALDQHWQPDALIIDAAGGGVAFQPLGHDLARCANAAITEHQQTLVVDGEQGRCFQAMLALGRSRTRRSSPARPPRCCSLRWRLSGSRSTPWSMRAGLVTVRRSRRCVSGSRMSSTPTTSRCRARCTGRACSRGRTGCSRASTRRSCRPAGTRRCSTPRRIAAGDVLRASPACGWVVVMRDYTQQLTVEQFGGMVATASRTVGSARGPYLGYTPTGAPLPVRFDPTRAPREDRASGVLLIGTLGSGKTVAAQAIEYAAERRGSLVVDFDPKPDHGLHELPELRDRMQVLELSGDPEQRRKAGGQPGHRGSGRGLLGEDQMKEIVDHYPSECSGCGHEFTEVEKVPRWGAGRHQLAELPAITVEYVEHRTHRLRCPGCKTRTRGTLGVVGESAFGAILQAALVTLTARNRVSRRDLSELAGELFGVAISVGAIDEICQRASGLLAEPHEQLVAGVLGSGAINVDETGWFLAGENRSMWTAATGEAAIFRIVADRHRDRLIELLGAEFAGIVTSDRWWAYDHLDPEHRQACWSHLQRDFRFHSEGLALQKEFGQAGLELTGRMFKARHAFGEHQDRERLILEMKPIQDEFLALLQHAGKKSKRHRLHRRFTNNLLKIWPALWTFLTVPAVTPTNNATERALRGPVIHRKLNHGNQSDADERFTERSLSASQTCRPQHPSPYTYLTQLFTAHQHGDALPTLTRPSAPQPQGLNA